MYYFTQYYYHLPEGKLRKLLVPGLDESDWRSIVRMLHLSESSGIDPTFFGPKFSTYWAHKQLQHLALEQWDSSTHVGFLYETALTREPNDLKKILPQAYQEVGLKEPLPNGLFDHLALIIEQYKELPLGEQASLVWHLLENRRDQRTGDSTPPLTEPYLDLFYAAWGVCDFVYYEENGEQFYENNCKAFMKLVKQILTEQPEVTSPQDMEWVNQ